MPSWIRIRKANPDPGTPLDPCPIRIRIHQHLCTVPIPESSKEFQNGDQELPEGQTGGRRVGSVDDAAH
jgi:hypothetical protein